MCCYDLDCRLREAEVYAHACQPFGAAVLRAHGQDGYLDECIRGERTALRQAVRPNGRSVSLAAMRRFGDIVSTLLICGLVAPVPDQACSTE